MLVLPEYFQPHFSPLPREQIKQTPLRMMNFTNLTQPPLATLMNLMLVSAVQLAQATAYWVKGYGFLVWRNCTDDLVMESGCTSVSPTTPNQRFTSHTKLCQTLCLSISPVCTWVGWGHCRFLEGNRSLAQSGQTYGPTLKPTDLKAAASNSTAAP